jgi:F-type H+-transporting ATPase subunit delta
MLLKAVAQRYADALLSLEKKAGGLDELEKDLVQVVTTLREHDGLRHALESPTVASSKKQSVLEGVFKKEISQTVLHFLYVLVDKKREEYLETILSVFQERLRERRGEVACHVRSAKPLTSSIRKDLEKSLKTFSGKDIQLTEEVEPELLAGMVITVGDRVIDTSFRQQLREVEDRLSRVE